MLPAERGEINSEGEIMDLSKCYQCGRSKVEHVNNVCPPSSVASACSGADARQADKAGPEPRKTFDEWLAEFRAIGGNGWDSVDDVEAEIRKIRGEGDCQPKEAAVSPRSGDGQIADKALHLYRLMHAVGSHHASGYVVIDNERVRISIKSQENTA